MIVIQIYSNTKSKTMSDKGKTSTTLSFRCPHDMLQAIDSIGRQSYPTDKNSKTNSGCDRSKALFHIIQAGIASLTDGDIQLEVRQQSKTDSKTAIDQEELEELVKKLISDNQVIQPGNTTDDSVRHLIKKSIADGDIKDAIFNGILEEVRELKEQLQELRSVSLFPVPNDQRPMTSDQLPITDDQLPITDDQRPITDDQRPMTSDQLPTTNDQLPITSDQLPITNDQLPDLNKSQIENVRGYFSRKKIKVDVKQIRKAFSDAGWDGNNWEESRSKAIEILTTEIK